MCYTRAFYYSAVPRDGRARRDSRCPNPENLHRIRRIQERVTSPDRTAVFNLIGFDCVGGMEEIVTDEAPESIGPYSQGMKSDVHVFVSGQGPVDPETGEIVGDDISEQTAQTLENIGAVLRAARSSLDQVVKTNVFVTDIDNYEAVNEVYGEYMSSPYPARSAVEVADLPIDIGVEIEAVAEY